MLLLRRVFWWLVIVPDERIDVLKNMYNPERVIPTTYEFTDIAGLVKGASNGEGLGNKFLSHIREVDAVVEVVRCFDDENIIHVDGSVDPIRDYSKWGWYKCWRKWRNWYRFS